MLPIGAKRLRHRVSPHRGDTATRASTALSGTTQRDKLVSAGSPPPRFVVSVEESVAFVKAQAPLPSGAALLRPKSAPAIRPKSVSRLHLPVWIYPLMRNDADARSYLPAWILPLIRNDAYYATVRLYSPSQVRSSSVCGLLGADCAHTNGSVSATGASDVTADIHRDGSVTDEDV